MMTAAGMDCDDWQRRVLRRRSRNLLLLCARQAGKSTVVAAIALHEVLFKKDRLVLILSSSQKQANEMLVRIKQLYEPWKDFVPADTESKSELGLANGSRIVSVPTRDPKAAKGYSAHILIFDEAAEISDETYAVALPTVTATRGRTVALSTPMRAMGWFWAAATDSGRSTVDEAVHLEDGWDRVVVRVDDCPRRDQELIDRYRNERGESVYLREYECQFEQDEEINLNRPLRDVVDLIPTERGEFL